MQNLQNKVVLITGASSGFGEETALLFAKEGCKVVLAARRIDRLQNRVLQIGCFNPYLLDKTGFLCPPLCFYTRGCH